MWVDFVGGNLACGEGGILNHWGKCRTLDKWCWHLESRVEKRQTPIPITHKGKSPMDKRPVKLSKENISIKAKGRD